MATLKELREQMAVAATEARSLLDQASEAKDEARAAELEAQHDKAIATYDALAAKVERQERLEEIERKQSDAAEAEERAKREAKRPGATPGKADQGGDMDYGTAFRDYLRCQGQVGAMSPEARAVLEQGYAQIEQRAQTTTTTAGGYTVPAEMANFIVTSMAAYGPMYDPGITMEMVTSGGNQITIPTVNDTASVSVKHTEGTTLTDDGGSDVTFGQKTLDAYPFNTEWLRVSKELVDDSAFNIEQFLGGLLGERLGRRANTELTTGDGSGDPNGIVTASAAGKTAASTTAITMDELIDLIHSVDPAYRASPRVRFMFNDTTFAAIRKLKDGDGQYLWQPNNQQGAAPLFMGYAYSVNQAMVNPATGTKPVIFGDFGKYIVRKVGSPLIGAIQDKDFWPGFGIAGYIRFDGELTDTAAVKHLLMA